ncbi:MAG: methyl-accepting chemotaxis sensory transducer [Herbinix sp.]|jgi:methyl-accepting chemotaxis protein|nr:methyl-accepting chemotaxis sensory transducer [Herbinix sp.]
MDKNHILSKNEQEANKLAAKITLITVLFIALVYVLNVIGIFIAPKGPMTIAMSLSTILMLIPPFFVYGLKLQGKWVKYTIVTVCILMVAVMNLLLSWHVIVLFIYPVAISSLFFSRKLSWFAVIVSLVLFTVSQYSSLYINAVKDLNLQNPFEMILYGVLPRSIELVALSAIFITLSGRTKKLLQNVVGAEEQKDTLDKIITLTDKSYEVSNVLSQSVKSLSEVTENTIRANEEITKKTGNIVDGSQQTMKYVDEAGSVVISVSSKLNEIANENHMIAEVSQEAKALTEHNTVIMRDAAEEMRQIDLATKESRTIITRLGEKSNEISNIVEVIKGITNRTNLLALNASIESARAGEQGKGFAVVASEIRALAEQSQKAANNISKLILTVLEDTQRAVESIDLNAQIVENGIAVIDKADQSSQEVTRSIDRMNEMAQKIADLSTTVAQNGDRIAGAVDGISRLTYNSMGELKTILTASEQQLAAMNEVAASVESISTTSDELLNVVHKSKM